MKAVRPSSEYMKAKSDERNALISEFSRKKSVRSNYFKIVPKTYHWNLLKLFTGKKSMKLAIKMKCLDCCCYQKNEVSACTVEICPLYDFRPYK